jgi:hypothetical protein
LLHLLLMYSPSRIKKKILGCLFTRVHPPSWALNSIFYSVSSMWIKRKFLLFSQQLTMGLVSSSTWYFGNSSITLKLYTHTHTHIFLLQKGISMYISISCCLNQNFNFTFNLKLSSSSLWLWAYSWFRNHQWYRKGKFLLLFLLPFRPSLLMTPA